jgi:hypothetical protein
MMMFRLCVWLMLAALVGLYACAPKERAKTATPQRAGAKRGSAPLGSAKNANSFSRYDTLIPILDGLLLTYDTFDRAQYEQLMKVNIPDFVSIDSIQAHRDGFGLFNYDYSPKAKKWGVIDSTGGVVVPFVCDGIKATSPHECICSIYASSFSLNTGIPRYMYKGYWYTFDKNGLRPSKGKAFDLRLVFIGDFHRHEFVISEGPQRYLPENDGRPAK